MENKKIKLTYVLGNCSSGGAEILVKNQLLELSKCIEVQEIELWVLMKVKDDLQGPIPARLEFEKYYLNELKKEKIKVIFLEKRANKDMIKTWFKIRKNYNRFRPNVIHCHLFNPTFHTVMGLIGKRANIIQTIHGLRIRKSNIYRYLFRFFIKKYISISEEITEVMLRKGLEKNKIVEIKNGIPLETFLLEGRVVNSSVKKILAIGRLTEAKNYSLMLKSFKVLIRTLKEKPTLLIVGGGEEKNQIEFLIKELKLEKNVDLLGIRRDISLLLKTSDLYLMTSITEGLSISLIEASASGIPILATDVGSNNLVLKNGGGILAKSKSLNEFSEKLIDIYGNYELRKSISEQAIKNSRGFDIKENVKKLIKVYKSL